MKHDAEARSQPTAVKRASSERAAGNVLKENNGIRPTHQICLRGGSNAVQEACEQPSGENCAEWSDHCYQERLVFPAEARSKNDLSLFTCLRSSIPSDQVSSASVECFRLADRECTFTMID